MRKHAQEPFDEVEALEREERRRRALRRTLLLAFALLLAGGIAGAGAVRNAAFLPAWAMPTPTPSAAPRATPSPAPQQGAAEPSPTPGGTETFSATAIVIDGTLAGVVASREAAQALLDDAAAHFERLIADVGLPVTSIENEIELREATAEETAGLASYESMFEVLTGGSTPLRVITTLTTETFDIVSCETTKEGTKYLVKGTQLIVRMGQDGSVHDVRTARYVNGRASGKPAANSASTEPIGGAVLYGTQAVDRHADPGRSEGQRGPNAGELTFIKPLADGSVQRNFGQYRGVLHLGLDYKAKAGEPVLASAAGTVVCAMERGGYGLMVEIDHGGGFVTRYAHLESAGVALGQSLAQGETLGAAGASGNAAGVMLHFELRVDGIAYNPRFYLK